MDRKLQNSKTKSIGKKIPQAAFSGTLEVGNTSLPCYVLEDGRRIFSTKGMIESLGYKGNANANEIFSNQTLVPFMAEHGNPYNDKNITDFKTDRGSLAKGIDVEKFMDICHAYSEALDSGVLQGRNEHAAVKANIFIRACSKIGIVALVDEATGYQHVRAEDALQFKLKLYLAEEMRAWEKTFPDALWIEFARLTDWDGVPTKNRPRYWGYLVMELIYRYLDPDVATYIKDNKPKPRKGQNYHQWFNGDFGAKTLIEHINRVIGMAQGCDTMDELKKKMRHRYGHEPLQLELFIDNNFGVKNDAFKLNMSFDETVKKILDTPPVR